MFAKISPFVELATFEGVAASIAGVATRTCLVELAAGVLAAGAKGVVTIPKQRKEGM